nr:SLC13 family permease [Spelaeicoccus albus]
MQWPGRQLARWLAWWLLGVLVVVTGVLPPDDFAALAWRVGPILGFVASITVVVELATSAGLFDVVGDRIAAWGRHTGWLIWLLVVGAATVSTAFLSLDTTAVVLTPIVVLLARKASMSPLPFALTTVWLANTASVLLPVSNVTNLLAWHRWPVHPIGFAGAMWAPFVVGVALPAALVWLLYRRRLAHRYSPPPRHVAADKPLLVTSGTVVAALLPALVSGVPVWIPSTAAAVLLTAAFAVRRPGTLRPALIPWRAVSIAAVLFIVVQAAAAHGLTTAVLTLAGTGNGYPELLRLAGVAALAANVVNNLPAYLALEPAAGTPIRLGALLIGVNLGAIVTPWASLAVLLWHERVASLGVRMSWRRYSLVGLGLTVVLVPAAVGALWLAHGLPG